jgi:hypothetical protein
LPHVEHSEPHVEQFWPPAAGSAITGSGAEVVAGAAAAASTNVAGSSARDDLFVTNRAVVVSAIQNNFRMASSSLGERDPSAPSSSGGGVGAHDSAGRVSGNGNGGPSQPAKLARFAQSALRMIEKSMV